MRILFMITGLALSLLAVVFLGNELYRDPMSVRRARL